MNTQMLILIAVAAYIFLSPRRRAQVIGPQPGVGEFGPGGSAVTLPGFGSYRSGPGGTTVSIDPNFLSRLFPPSTGPGTGLIAAPTGPVGGFFGGIGGGTAMPVPLPPTAGPGPIWNLPSAPADQLIPVYPGLPLDAPPSVPFEPIPGPEEFFPPDLGPTPIPVDPCLIDPYACSIGADWGWAY